MPATTPGRPADTRLIDEAIFESDLVRVGRFRCASSFPAFDSASSPTQNYCFVFPRVAVSIEHEDAPAFVADLNTIPVYNAGRPYVRRAVRGGDDRSDWFGIAPELLREMVAERDGRSADGERPFRFRFTRSSADLYLAQRRLYRYVKD